jgi:hypothetical protein
MKTQGILRMLIVLPPPKEEKNENDSWKFG